ncbi:MAG: hypothetical protein AB2A00_40270 [Myxococcota bacterium]
MNAKRWLTAALLAALPACQFCEEPPLETIPPNPDQTDEFCQRPASRVDILWVIDNSGSMLSEQNKVADRFSEFFRQLQTSLVDYHIGVITTDIREGFNEDANGILRRYDGPSVPGCNGCRWLTKDVPCNNPNVTRNQGESDSAYEARLQNECTAALVFRRLVTSGAGGGAFERGLESSTMALGAIIDPDTGGYASVNGEPAVPDVNKGFLRRRTGTCQPVANQAGLDCAQQEGENCSEPALYVIYVSDEEDGSSAPSSRYYYRVLEGLKGPGNEAKISTSAITGWPANAAVPITRACEIYNKAQDTDPNNDQEWPALERILRKELGGCRDVNAAPEDGNASAEVGTRYIEVACRTGGVVSDLCSGDYTTALNQLGADAAGLARKFTISRWNEVFWGDDGEAFTPDDEDMNCDGDAATKDAQHRTFCVFATPLGSDAEVLVRRDDATGWRLEPSTRSIRFDGSFIPKPGTKVTIKYRLKTQGQ